MAERDFYSDLNLNFNQLLQARSENVASLPTLTSEDTGSFVYLNNKLYVWNGEAWHTWGEETKFSIENVTVTATYSDDDIFELKSQNLYNYTSNVSYSRGFTGALAQTLGTLSCIGGSTDVDVSEELTSPIDWDIVDGRRFVVTARDGSWFNIKNQYAEPNANAKAINTLTGSNISHVVKAEFVYRHSGNEWLLVSYELQHLYQHYVVSSTAKLRTNDIGGWITLPRKGTYSIDIFLEIIEWDVDQITAIPTKIQQRLSVGGRVVDTSGSLIPSVTSPDVVWFNHSLQGSTILDITTSDILHYNAILPNGVYSQILSGYIDVHFIK